MSLTVLTIESIPREYRASGGVSMRRCLAPILALALAVTALPGVASAQSRSSPPNPFGLGLVLGVPWGLSAKYYLGDGMALQMGLGGARQEWHGDGLHLHVEVLWHPAILAREAAFTLPFYVGVGGRIFQHNHHYYYCDRGRCWWTGSGDDDVHLGARVPFGILMDFNNVPIDVFLELAMVVDFLYLGPRTHDHRHVHINGGLGVRYYF
jgi:hypothetical protein